MAEYNMKLKHTIFHVAGFSLVNILLLLSCQSEIKTVTTTSLNATAINTVISQPTLEPIITSSPTSIATATLTIETTGTPETTTGVATPTLAVVTLTPLPTLEKEQFEAAVAELLANPMNCDAPCWWGAIPSITKLEEVKHNIAPYNFHIDEYEEDGEVIHLLLEIGNTEGLADYDTKIVYNFFHSVLTGVTAYAPPISEVLSRYGTPDEVWIWVMNDPRETQPTLWINMLYLQAGMGISYVVDIDIQDDTVTGCFVDEETGSLRLITLNSANSYKDFSPIFQKDRLYLSLEDATNLTIEDFMQRFSDSSLPQCIETSAELWD